MFEKLVATSYHDGTEFVARYSNGKYDIIHRKDGNVATYNKNFFNEKDVIAVAEMLCDCYDIAYDNGVSHVIEAEEALEDELY